MPTVVEILVAVASLVVALTFLAIPGLLVGQRPRLADPPGRAHAGAGGQADARDLDLVLPDPGATGMIAIRTGPTDSLNPAVELFYMCFGVAWATAGGYALWRMVSREADPGRRPIEAPRPH